MEYNKDYGFAFLKIADKKYFEYISIITEKKPAVIATTPKIAKGILGSSES